MAAPVQGSVPGPEWKMDVPTETQKCWFFSGLWTAIKIRLFNNDDSVAEKVCNLFKENKIDAETLRWFSSSQLKKIDKKITTLEQGYLENAKKVVAKAIFFEEKNVSKYEVLLKVYTDVINAAQRVPQVPQRTPSITSVPSVPLPAVTTVTLLQEPPKVPSSPHLAVEEPAPAPDPVVVKKEQLKKTAEAKGIFSKELPPGEHVALYEEDGKLHIVYKRQGQEVREELVLSAQGYQVKGFKGELIRDLLVHFAALALQEKLEGHEGFSKGNKADVTAKLQGFVKTFGKEAENCFALFRQGDEIHIAYVHQGKVAIQPADILPEALLVGAKPYTALDSKANQVQSCSDALEQFVRGHNQDHPGKIYTNKSVAEQSFREVVDTFKPTGAFVLWKVGEGRFEGLVQLEKKAVPCTFDLTKEPGKIHLLLDGKEETLSSVRELENRGFKRAVDTYKYEIQLYENALQKALQAVQGNDAFDSAIAEPHTLAQKMAAVDCTADHVVCLRKNASGWGESFIKAAAQGAGFVKWMLGSETAISIPKDGWVLTVMSRKPGVNQFTLNNEEITIDPLSFKINGRFNSVDEAIASLKLKGTYITTKQLEEEVQARKNQEPTFFLTEDQASHILQGISEKLFVAILVDDKTEYVSVDMLQLPVQKRQFAYAWMDKETLKTGNKPPAGYTELTKDRLTSQKPAEAPVATPQAKPRRARRKPQETAQALTAAAPTTFADPPVKGRITPVDYNRFDPASTYYEPAIYGMILYAVGVDGDNTAKLESVIAKWPADTKQDFVLAITNAVFRKKVDTKLLPLYEAMLKKVAGQK